MRERRQQVTGKLWRCLALAVPVLARGAAYDVEARTEAQADTIAAWNGGAAQALTRRRLVQSLDLAGFEVVPGEDAGLSLRVRFDADFSVNDRELTALDDGWRDRLQLVRGRLHWNGIAGGRVDVELGRLGSADALGAWQFDGARTTWRPVRWLELTGFGGLRVTGSSWLASAVLAPDGTRSTDRRRLAAGLEAYPCPGTASRDCADPTLDDPAPTGGARLAFVGAPVGIPGGAEVEVRQAARAGKVLEERVLAAGRTRAGPLAVEVAGEYDLYVERLAALRGALRAALVPGLALSLEAAHSHPTFSADSIWNVFVTVPSREVRLRADLAPTSWPARLYAAAGLKRYESPDFSYADLPRGVAWEPSGALGGEGQVGATRLAADVSARGGATGLQAWLSALARRPLGSWLGLEARGTLARIEDRVTPRNGGTFPALALTLTGRLERRAQLALLVEDSAPRGTRNDLRLFAFLTLGAEWDTRLRP
jgi:hypothetical protein